MSNFINNICGNKGRYIPTQRDRIEFLIKKYEGKKYDSSENLKLCFESLVENLEHIEDIGIDSIVLRCIDIYCGFNDLLLLTSKCGSNERLSRYCMRLAIKRI